jgi:hypothetical protein
MASHGASFGITNAKQFFEKLHEEQRTLLLRIACQDAMPSTRLSPRIIFMNGFGVNGFRSGMTFAKNGE